MADQKVTATADILRQLGDENIRRISRAIDAHPRFNKLFTGLDGLYAWSERAETHYLSEIQRIGPTEARKQIGRIVNQVALVGDAR
jgi:hypothetical protein